MPERQLVHQSERRTTQDRNLAAGLQPAASAQFVGLLAARRVCTDTSGDERMRKTSTWLLEQGTQTPSPAPDLIPAETRTENSHWDWYSERGHFSQRSEEAAGCVSDCSKYSAVCFFSHPRRCPRRRDYLNDLSDHDRNLVL